MESIVSIDSWKSSMYMSYPSHTLPILPGTPNNNKDNSNNTGNNTMTVEKRPNISPNWAIRPYR